MKNKIGYTISTMVCGVCHARMYVPRLNGRPRKMYHVKDIYCPGCRAMSKFLEYRGGDPIMTMDEAMGSMGVA